MALKQKDKELAAIGASIGALAEIVQQHAAEITAAKAAAALGPAEINPRPRERRSANNAGKEGST